MRQDADGGARVPAAVARSSSPHRSPAGSPRPASASATTDNTAAKTRDYAGDGQSGTEKLRDHWSQSSYSPGQSQIETR